ncbi:MAG: ABC transporter permease, partial [Bacillota bacterium]
MIKLFRFLNPYRAAITGVIVLTFLQTLSELYLPTLMSNIVDIGIVGGNTRYIMNTGGYMLLVAAGGAVCAIVGGFWAARIAMGFGQILRGRIFAHVESFSLPEFDRIGTASLITRTTNDITQIQTVTFMLLRLFMIAPLMCIGGIIIAVTKEPGLSWIILVTLPVLAITIWLIAGKSVPIFQVIQVKLDKLNRVLREGLTGIRVIRAFNRIDFEKERFHDANEDLTSTTIRVNKIMAALMPVMMLIMNFTTIAIIWFGGLRIDRGNMQVGNLMAFLQYVMQILFSLLMFSMIFVLLPRASASAKRVNEVLAITPGIKNPTQPKGTGPQKGFLEFR